MGMMLGWVVFEDDAPPLSEICSTVTELCGLPVVVLESTEDELHDSYATVAFACAPAVPLTVFTYRRRVSTYMKKFVEGTNEPLGTQTVYLEGFVGQERTLIVATELALESLGGIPYHAIPDDDRQEFGKQISESELEERHVEMKRQMQKIARTTVLMLPIIILMWIIVSAWTLVTTPFRIWYGFRRHKTVRPSVGPDGE